MQRGHSFLGHLDAVQTGTVAIVVVTATVPEGSSAPILIYPRGPLAENTTYVIAVKAGLLDSDGRPFRRNATYNLASYPLPLVVDGETNPAAVVDLGAGIGPKPVSDLLKCSQASAGVVRLSQRARVSGHAGPLARSADDAPGRSAPRDADPHGVDP